MARVRPNTIQSAHGALGAAAEAWAEQDGGEALRFYGFRHGVAHLLSCGRPQSAEALLTDFTYCMARLKSANGSGARPLAQDTGAVKEASGLEDAEAFRIWEEFFRTKVHILTRGDANWGAEKILLQLAVEHADDSPVTRAAEAWLEDGHCDWLWLRTAKRPEKAGRSPLIRVMHAHQTEVVGVESLDDERFVSWDKDGGLAVWQLSASTPVYYQEPEDGLSVRGAMRISPERFVVWAEDGTLQLRSATASKPLRTFVGHNAAIMGGLNLKESLFATWSEDGVIVVWDQDNSQPLSTVEHPTEDKLGGVLPVLADSLLSWSKCGAIRLWSLEHDGMTLLGELRCEKLGKVVCFGSSVIAAGTAEVGWATWPSDADSVQLLSLPDFSLIYSVEKEVLQAANPNFGILTSTDQAIHLRGGSGDEIIWSCGCYTLHQHRYNEIPAAVGTARLGPNGVPVCWQALFCGYPKSLPEILIGDKMFIADMDADGFRSCLAGDYLVQGFSDYLEVIDLASCKAESRLSHSGLRTSFALSERLCVTSSDNGELRAWDLVYAADCTLKEKRSPDWMLPGQPYTLGCSKTSTGGIHSINVYEVFVWNTVSGALEWTGRKNSSEPVDCALLLSNTQCLTDHGVFDLPEWTQASTGTGKVIGLLGTGEIIRRSPTHLVLSKLSDVTATRRYEWPTANSVVEGVRKQQHGEDAAELPVTYATTGAQSQYRDDSTFEPFAVIRSSSRSPIVTVLDDGRILGSANESVIAVWDRESTELLLSLVGHHETIHGQRFLPKNRLVSWADKGEVKVWDLASGTEIHSLEGHTRQVLGAVLLDTGKLLSWSEDDEFRIWDIDTGACSHRWSFEEAARTQRHLFYESDLWAHESGLAARSEGSRLEVVQAEPETSPVGAWQGDGAIQIHFLTEDGTVALVENDEQTHFLKLHHGNRRVTFDEAAGLLSSEPSRPAEDA